MPTKNPPITGAAQSVTSAHLREMSKGRPDPAAPPPKERKNFGSSKKQTGTKDRSVAPEADKPNRDEE